VVVIIGVVRGVDVMCSMLQHNGGLVYEVQVCFDGFRWSVRKREGLSVESGSSGRD
jgi:hypothetical protein